VRFTRSALFAVVTLAGCGSHNGAGGDGKIDSPPLGDCGCDGVGSDGSNGGSDGSGSAMPDAPTDAMTCDMTPACPSGQWCTETVPVGNTTLLRGVWAIDNNDVFAVGNGGVLMRRRCNQWTQITTGTTQNLTAVWASPTDLWAIGDAGTILRYDGNTVTPVTGVTTADLYAISGTSASDVWIVDGSGDALWWNGATWTTRGVGGNLLGVAGTGDGDVWVTGETAYVRHANDVALWTNTTSWPTLKPEGASGTDYFAILERSTTNIWVASTSGTTLQYNGSTWTPHSTGGVIFSSLWARADNDIWGAGQMKIGHWNGTMWSDATPAGITSTLTGVGGTATDVWVVGGAATVLHRD